MIAGAGLEGITMVDEDSEKDKPVEPPAHGTILASIELGYWGGGRICVGYHYYTRCQYWVVYHSFGYAYRGHSVAG